MIYCIQAYLGHTVTITRVKGGADWLVVDSGGCYGDLGNVLLNRVDYLVIMLVFHLVEMTSKGLITTATTKPVGKYAVVLFQKALNQPEIKAAKALLRR